MSPRANTKDLLKPYRQKRRFDISAEPPGRRATRKGYAYVIQKHAARRLHYDLRLELDGVMKSWAVTRGPSLVPGEKRLAIHVEDHPIDYNAFEGTIPKGEYGGGTVMIWDRGTWTPEGDPHVGYKKGHLQFQLDGEKLKGSWHLVRMRRREGERQDPWLLIKSEDDTARSSRSPDILEEEPRSVVSGRSLDEIAAGKNGKAVWHSNRTHTPSDAVEEAEPRKRSARTPAKKPVKKAAKKATKKTPKPPARKDAAKKSTQGAAKSKAKAAGKRASPGTKAKAKSAAKLTRVEARKGKLSDEAEGPPGLASSRTPVPDFVPPCLARLCATAPNDSRWVHEVKFDGYRIQARLANGKVRLKTRTGLDWTGKFSPVAKALEVVPARAALIDGEIVVEAKGVPDFSALQEALKAGGGAFLFYAFDLLHLNGLDIRHEPLIARKQLLQELLTDVPSDGPIRFSEHFETDGASFLGHACGMKLEGIISKQRDAPYRSGRMGDWLKIKCSARQEFVIAGYVPATNDPKAVGALVLGYYKNSVLQYAGRVGTGFTHRSARDLWRRLQTLRQDGVPFAAMPPEERRRGALWVTPLLVAEVDFIGWTAGMRLRHPAFKGLREDKRATEVVREEEAMAPTPRTTTSDTIRKPSGLRRVGKGGGAANASIGGVDFTHPERVYWEDAGVTKQGLAEYYVAVWDWIAPHVTGRVLSLLRCPDGAEGTCFFQKHASAGLEERHLKMIDEDGDRVISIDELDGLLSLVQAGGLELHVRGSRVDHLDACDRIVFDLDPGPDVEWPELKRAAKEVRERLESMSLESWVKTTGGKGLHVVVPIEDKAWESVKKFARSVAEAMVGDSPGRYVAVATKSKRKGKIFVDYLRNSREATAICPYSTRARPGATVSVPVAWSELGALKQPNLYTVGNLMQRLRRLKRDPWADLVKVKQRLPAAVR